MSTQNDWEKELLQALILDQPPVEVMFIKGVENLVRTCTWSQFVTVVDKFRADARKEERMKADVKSEKPKYNQICKMTTSGKHMYEERVVTFNGMCYKKCILCEVIDDADRRNQANY